MYITGIVIGLAIIFEAILIGRKIVWIKRFDRWQEEKRKNWNNAWI